MPSTPPIPSPARRYGDPTLAQRSVRGRCRSPCGGRLACIIFPFATVIAPQFIVTGAYQTVPVGYAGAPWYARHEGMAGGGALKTDEGRKEAMGGGMLHAAEYVVWFGRGGLEYDAIKIITTLA